MLRFLAFVVLGAIATFSGAEAQPTHGPTSQTSGPDYRAKIEKETFLLINQYRKSSDLPALAWNETIAKEARAHSKDMATGDVDFGHEGFGDRVSRLKSDLPGFWGAGENVFMSSELDDVAHLAVTRWLHSPHHLKNIRGEYTISGLGVWQDKDGVIYFTQIFVNIKPSVPQTQAEPVPGVNTPFGILAAPETRDHP
jgi:uncharacterized protein YkwD